MELNTNGQPTTASTPQPDPLSGGGVAQNVANAADQVQQTPPSAPQQTDPVQAAADPNHPTSIFHKVMETLGGGPSVSYKTDQNGNMVRTTAPRSGGDIAKSIMAGALTGLFASAGKRGPGAAMAAFGAGGQAVSEQAQQADAQKRGQAQQDFQNNQQDQLKKAQVAEANSRTIMNNMQVEKLQGEALDDYVSSAQPMLASMGSLADANNLTQAELMSGLQSGKYHTANDLFIPDGKVPKIGPDGKPVMGKNGIPESEVTYAHVNNGPVAMTQDIYDAAAAAGIAKYKPGTKVAQNQMVPASQLLSLQQQITAVDTAQHEVQAVRQGLGIKGSFDWNAVKSTPGMSTALMKFQGYMHAAGDDPLAAIQAMSAEKQDPKTGRMIANPDAKFSNLVTQAFGGGDLLRKYHDKLAADSEAQKAGAKANAELPAAIAKEDNVAANTEARAEARDARKNAQNDVATFYNITPQDTPDQIVKKLPPSVAADVKALVDYRANPKTFTTNPRRGDGLSREKAYALANMIDPTWDDTQYKSRQDMRVDYTTGKTSSNIRAIGTAIHHMAALNDAQSKLYNTGFSTINAVKEGITPSFLSGSQKQAQESIDAVTHEVANVFAGHGANIPELKAWTDSIKSTASHREFQAWIQQGMKLMAGRAQQIAGDWNKGMGKPYDFSILTPGAKEELKSLPGGDELAGQVGITKGGAGAGPGGLTPGASQYLQSIGHN